MTPEWKNKFEEILQRELLEEEIIRFDKIKDILKIHDNDVMLDMMIIFEYHKNYCDMLPGKIETILSNYKPTKTENSELKSTKKNSNLSKNNSISSISTIKKAFTLNTYILLLMLFNVCSMWIGYSFAYSAPTQFFTFFTVPVGYCISLLAFIQGIHFLLKSINILAEKEKNWKKFLLFSILSFILSLFPFLHNFL